MVHQDDQPRHVNSKTKSTQHSIRVSELLYQQLHEWRDVRYRYGGLSKSGIDCSGFVHITFLTKLGHEIPRSTQLLAQSGYPISQSQLQPGDLVFFKTGRSKNHVGIYAGNRQFIHASTSQGVTQSHLDNVYWSKHYWQSRRL